jgi:hypothetical protein
MAAPVMDKLVLVYQKRKSRRAITSKEARKAPRLIGPTNQRIFTSNNWDLYNVVAEEVSEIIIE